MIDAIHPAVLVAMLGLCACSRRPRKGCETMLDIVAGIVGVLLIAYLFVSVVRPEKF